MPQGGCMQGLSRVSSVGVGLQLYSPFHGLRLNSSDKSATVFYLYSLSRVSGSLS